MAGIPSGIKLFVPLTYFRGYRGRVGRVTSWEAMRTQEMSVIFPVTPSNPTGFCAAIGPTPREVQDLRVMITQELGPFSENTLVANPPVIDSQLLTPACGDGLSRTGH